MLVDPSAIQLERLQDAEDNYYITAKYLLSLSNRVYDLFLSSEVEERRQLIKFVLQNLKVKGEKIVCDVQKPFDMILDCVERKAWCA